MAVVSAGCMGGVWGVYGARTFEALDMEEKKAEHASCMIKLPLPLIPASTTALIAPFAAKAAHVTAPAALPCDARVAEEKRRTQRRTI